jgi:hypothetical protein
MHWARHESGIVCIKKLVNDQRSTVESPFSDDQYIGGVIVLDSNLNGAQERLKKDVTAPGVT